MESCDICGVKAPFKRKNGTHYLEVHHIEWLSKGENDLLENTVALCPNRHKNAYIKLVKRQKKTKG
ncbi:HNH endonuclease [Megasphaera paucivorans]|uniref:HNH endonuclease n=1 Tax=Megasphaera paucivorans TaxID=349095 RepID=UPI001C40A97A|nr:HNH endonuclease [Megasphaera paucivorans]